MENTEIMTNNEVVEVAEDLVPASSGNGLKMVGGALVIAGLIYGSYKLITKIKAKKKEKAEEAEVECNEFEDECVAE